jgi:hypothetical protein
VPIRHWRPPDAIASDQVTRILPRYGGYRIDRARPQWLRNRTAFERPRTSPEQLHGGAAIGH